MPATAAPIRERYITIRATAAEQQRLRDAAAERNVSVASLVRKGLADQGIKL